LLGLDRQLPEVFACASRQPYLGSALPPSIRGRANKRRLKNCPISFHQGGKPHSPGVPICGRHKSKKLKLNVAAWNVRTLRDNNNCLERRTAQISLELERCNVDIAALSETRLAEEGSLVEQSGGYTFFWKGYPPDHPAVHGVGIAVRSSLLRNVPESPRGISPRLMTWRLPLPKGEFVTIISAYAPTLASDTAAKDEFYSQLSDHLRRVPANDKLILLGDFNARVGTDYRAWEGVLGLHGVGTMNENGLRLLTLCSEHKLTVTNTLFQMRNMYKTTWMHPRSRHWHLIDFVMVRQRDRRSVITTRVLRSAEASTDHRLVRSCLRMSIRAPQRRRPPAQRVNLSNLSDRDCRDAFSRAVRDRLSDQPADVPIADDNGNYLDRRWDRLGSCLIDASVSVLGQSRKRHRDWFSENDVTIRNMLTVKNKAHDRALRTGLPADWEEFRAVRSESRSKMRDLQNSWWLEFSGEMQQYADANQISKFYDCMRSLCGPVRPPLNPVRSSDGTILHSDKASILARWAEYSEELLNRHNPHDLDILNDLPALPTVEELDAPPSMDEVRSALSSMKDGKAAGPDGVHSELLKHAGEEFLTELHDLFLECWRAEDVPQSWKNSNLVYIYKNKGDKSVCGNSRGISLLATAGKVLARCMLSRLLTEIVDKVVPESQCGFRRERGTVDMMFVMRQIQEKCREQHRDLFVAFIDLTKAFDTVNRAMLWTVLEKAGCSRKFVAVIRAFHEGMQASVCCAGESSTGFGVEVGVKQGCVLAPILFNIFLASIMKLIYTRLDAHEDGISLRYRLDGNIFNLQRLRAATKTSMCAVADLQYADDAALPSHTSEGLQRNLDAVCDVYSGAGLVISADKTEVLQQFAVAGTQPTDFTIPGATLKNTTEFRYLGSIVSDRVDLNPEVHRRIALSSSAFGRLSKRVFFNHDLSLHTKMTVFNAVCVSILLYGCETWTLYRAHTRKLESFYMDCLRKILGLGWWDRVSYAAIRQRLTVPPLEALIIGRQLRWMGHVVRMPADRVPKRIAYGELSLGHRTAGGQRKRYKDNIKSSLRRCNMQPGSLEVLAADRGDFRQACSRGLDFFTHEYESAAAARSNRRHAPQGEGEFPCERCGRACASLAGLRSHQRAHARRGAARRGPRQ